MSAKFTPGPWKYRAILPHEIKGDEVILKEGDPIGYSISKTEDLATGGRITYFIGQAYNMQGSGKDLSEAEANARLMAAAPKLYEALADIVRSVDQMTVDYLGPKFDAAMDALALAEIGEE